MVVAKNAIRDYNDMNLVDFNKTFEMSRFESKINDSDISIITNETVVTMKKIINPLLFIYNYCSISIFYFKFFFFIFMW